MKYQILKITSLKSDKPTDVVVNFENSEYHEGAGCSHSYLSFIIISASFGSLQGLVSIHQK